MVTVYQIVPPLLIFNDLCSHFSCFLPYSIRHFRKCSIYGMHLTSNSKLPVADL